MSFPSSCPVPRPSRKSRRSSRWVWSSPVVLPLSTMPMRPPPTRPSSRSASLSSEFVMAFTSSSITWAARSFPPPNASTAPPKLPSKTLPPPFSRACLKRSRSGRATETKPAPYPPVSAASPSLPTHRPPLPTPSAASGPCSFTQRCTTLPSVRKSFATSSSPSAAPPAIGLPPTLSNPPSPPSGKRSARTASSADSPGASILPSLPCWFTRPLAINSPASL